jgi:polar amino acid transport system substrate-binding protein
MRYICLLLLFFGCLPLVARAELAVTFCYEDKDSYPWVMADGSGLNFQLLNMVAAATELHISFVPVPWKRCLDGLARGRYDGAFAASFKTDRQAMGRYPMDIDGRLDESKRLHTSVYALYRLRGSSVGWNGLEFRQLSSSIGSLSGFSISDFLRAHGAQVDESSRDPLALLGMLKAKRVEAIALQRPRADYILQAHPELAAAIERSELPLEEKAYFLLLSNRFYQALPERAEAIWAEIERQRESADYQRAMHMFLARPQS